MLHGFQLCPLLEGASADIIYPEAVVVVEEEEEEEEGFLVARVLEAGPTGRDVGDLPGLMPGQGAATRATRWTGSSSRELSQHTLPPGGRVEGAAVVVVVVEGAVEGALDSNILGPMQSGEVPGRCPVAAT